MAEAAPREKVRDARHASSVSSCGPGVGRVSTLPPKEPGRLLNRVSLRQLRQLRLGADPAQSATRLWLFVHVPLAHGLLILMVVHAVLAYAFRVGA